MKRNNIKTQLDAMNSAIFEFSENEAKKKNLNTKETNAVKQRVLFAEPYNNMEVYRSNKLYKTMVNRAETVSREINQMKTEDEE